MQNYNNKSSGKIVVVKVGTNVLTLDNGKLDLNTIKNLVEQLSDLAKQKYQVVFVSSGAIGFGKALFSQKNKTVCVNEQIENRQIFSAVGQVELMRNYSEMFEANGLIVAQVLATKQDFSNRSHYLNMRTCLNALLKNQIIPIINENDTVAISELMFTDNDELAGLLATMLGAEKLMLLTNVEGLYTGNPSDPSSKLIHEVKYNDNLENFVTAGKSQFGRGGMQTKLDIAIKLAKMGITVHLANGKKRNVLKEIFAGESNQIGTTFIPHKSKSSIKRWMGFSQDLAQAKIVVNKCAEEILHSDKVISLLPVGIIGIDGDFEEGDLVKIVNEAGLEIGIGKAEYSSKDLQPILAKKGGKAFIHYDYMYIN